MPMTVMPSNNTGRVMRDLAERFPGRLAHLMSPGGWRTPFLPYALDNGAFKAYATGGKFDRDPFDDLVMRVRHFVAKGGHTPLWLTVPDVVANAAETLDSWARWEPELRPFGWPLAFVVQDGMNRQDVPTGADVVFVGGSLSWKWSWVPAWCAWYRRVHVGRVNRPEALDYLDHLGAESCDGTGWFRGDQAQLEGLAKFLAGQSNLRLFDASELREDEP